jgi:hypothetical protein
MEFQNGGKYMSTERDLPKIIVGKNYRTCCQFPVYLPGIEKID